MRTSARDAIDTYGSEISSCILAHFANERPSPRKMASSSASSSKLPQSVYNPRRHVGVHAERVTDVSSTEYPGHYPDEDHSWDLAKFKQACPVHSTSPRDRSQSLRWYRTSRSRSKGCHSDPWSLTSLVSMPRLQMRSEGS